MLEEVYLVQWSLNPVILAVVLLPTTILLFSILISYGSWGASSSKLNLPPSPPRLPVLGNLHQMSALPHLPLHSLAQNHSPVMLLKMGQTPNLVISTPELAMEVLKTQDHLFAGRPSFKASELLSYGNKNITFADYGDHWRQLKKICVTHLLSAKKVQSFRSLREEQVAVMVESIRRSGSHGRVVDLSKVLYEFTNGTIIRGITGSQSSSSTVASFREMLDEATSLIAGFQIDDAFPSLWWIGSLTGINRKLKTLFRNWDSFLNGVVDGPREGTDDGFVDVLLSLQKDPALGHVLSKDVVKTVTMDMTAAGTSGVATFGHGMKILAPPLAGTDTSYTVLEWTMSELIRHPEVMKKAKSEITSFSNGKSFVPEEDLNQMPFLKAVIKESLRMDPPAPLLIPHKTMDDTLVCGYNIPKNTRVIINVWSLARDPKWWETPDEFKPERFMDSGIDYKGQHYQFLPFGPGRRICPGMYFAMLSVELAIANLLYGFDWDLPEGEEALDMGEHPGITIRRAKKLELVARPVDES